MAMRSVVSRGGLGRLMEGNGMRSSTISGLRYFSDDKGRVLSEEERAKENVYIQKWERERLEKQKLKAEKEKAEHDKSDKVIITSSDFHFC
ncbi:OLC1v1026401C2 [Oldenlandia corymbosa var. corymbosa]|uniref:OLC1v1026401C2 n=1 Tax=Oldenlandia corymbosa var. corymbosa TaxID=529605 RepID=A0AAV1C902_OLDCO|nr:OLC1v1026401C2 [Oldenlandia corymbosa var. corymbosa]